MQKLIFILFLIVWVPGAMAQSQILIDAQSLKEKIGKKDVVILHIGQQELYNKEHIPGAQFISESLFTVSIEPHSFDLPPVNDLKSAFEGLGISNQSQIIIYTESNWVPSTTRLFFTLDYLGLRNQASILNGGLVAWKAAGGNVTDEVPSVTTASLKVNPKQDLVVDKEYVHDNLNKENVKIIDCRAAVFYQGIEDPGMHGGRKGRIPGAKSIPFTSIYSKTDRGSYEFKSVDDLKKVFEQQGIKKEDQLILYCHIGLQLTVVYTATQILGYPNVKVFDGSYHEWGADKNLPVEL